MCSFYIFIAKNIISSLKVVTFKLRTQLHKLKKMLWVIEAHKSITKHLLIISKFVDDHQLIFQTLYNKYDLSDHKPQLAIANTCIKTRRLLYSVTTDE